MLVTSTAASARARVVGMWDKLGVGGYSGGSVLLSVCNGLKEVIFAIIVRQDFIITTITTMIRKRERDMGC